MGLTREIGELFAGMTFDKRGVARDVLRRKFSDCASAIIDRDRALRLFDFLQGPPRVGSVQQLYPSLASAAE